MKAVLPLPTAISERQFSRFVLILMVLGFAALLTAGGATAYTVMVEQDHARWVEHTYKVEEQIGDVRTLVEQVETARRGYLLSRDPSIRESFLRLVRRQPRALNTMRAFTIDNPAQQANVGKLERLLATRIALIGRSVALADQDLPAAQAAFQTDGSLPLTRAIRAHLTMMRDEEQRLLVLRTAALNRSIDELFAVLAATGILMVLVGIFSMAVIRRYTRSLVTSRDAVERLNDELEDRVQERTQDLSRANEEIQRFAYIVSHDLRSPLVNVMGFTGELEAATKPLAALVDRVEAETPAMLAEDARLAAREDLPEAIGFIRQSTQKMDRLINAILRLSREGRRVLSPEHVDLAGLTADIVATLQHRLDEIDATVTIERPMPMLDADRLAVEQILSNLMENAVKYRKPGRPLQIVVTARQDRDRVVVEVADNGRGIDPKDHDRIFDLFRRSGAQDQPGEGIGLAHVRALAYRLGGLVDCRSALDEGATFALSLPSHSVPNQGSSS